MTIKFAPAQTDFYKMFHKEAYHPNITKVYSNFFTTRPDILIFRFSPI